MYFIFIVLKSKINSFVLPVDTDENEEWTINLYGKKLPNEELKLGNPNNNRLLLEKLEFQIPHFHFDHISYGSEIVTPNPTFIWWIYWRFNVFLLTAGRRVRARKIDFPSLWEASYISLDPRDDQSGFLCTRHPFCIRMHWIPTDYLCETQSWCLYFKSPH